MTSMIGQGYSDTVTPAVIRRNVLESPAWYTAYTPYQPEISQGRLEALLNFQTMVADLTGLEIANASLLDEATAVAEAVALMWRASKAKAGTVVLDAELFGQSREVTLGRAEAIGLPVVVADLTYGLPEVEGALVGVVLQQVGASGVVRDLAPLVAAAKERGALVTIAADLLALTLLRTPGELGADVSVGSAQRFGVPLFGGGPHAAFMAVRPGLERMLPGRLVGVSVDADGAAAYRLALQTREQHIRREKATSNICTAQALLAIVASMYAVYHGPDGLRAIAERVHGFAGAVAAVLGEQGVPIEHEVYFDTVRAHVPGLARAVVAAAARHGLNLWAPDDDHVQIACDETTGPDDVTAVLSAFVEARATDADPEAEEVRWFAFAAGSGAPLPTWATRSTPYLTHPVFHLHRSETAMLRYLRRLSDKDLALDRTMIPLGSCTMKLNATAEMEPISWPEFASHPPVRAGRPDARVRRAGRRSWRTGSRRSPATPRCRCSRTPARRASWPVCWRSAGTTRLARGRRRGARRVPDPGVRARHERGVGGPGRACASWSWRRPPTGRSTSTTCAPSSRSTARRWPRS